MDVTQERVDLAIKLLREHKSFSLGDIILECSSNDSEEIEVVITTGWAIANVSKKRIHQALGEAKRILVELCQSFDNLGEYLSRKKIVYRVIQDYVKGSISICYEKDGQIFYDYDLNE